MKAKAEDLLQQYPKRLVGLKQVVRGLTEDSIWCVIVSSDCDNRIKTTIKTASEGRKVLIESIDSMERLGKLCGIDVSAAVVGLVRE